MTKQDLQAELKAKVKEGIKPSHLKRSTSTPVKSTKEPTNNHAETITKLEQQKAELLAINQAAVAQNEQLVKIIEQLKQEKKNYEQINSNLEQQLLEKRLQLLKTPLANQTKPNIPHSPIKRNELELQSNLFALHRKDKEKNVLIIFLLITLAGALLLK